MIVDPVTNRWADALFAVAKSAGAVDEIQHDTARLSEEVSSPAVAAFLFGSSISQEAREQKFAPLLEQLHPKTQSFVRLLFAKRRQEVMRGIGDAFKRKVYDETGKIAGVVATQRELSEDDVQALATSIGGRIGKTVILSQTIQATQNPREVMTQMMRIGRRVIVSFPNFGNCERHAAQRTLPS